MLFNSVEFLFLFLPITLALYHLLRRHASLNSAFFLLIVASLFFYAWWQPKYLLLLSASVICNFFIAQAIYRYQQKWITTLGICLNLATIGYYKYSAFFLTNLASLTGADWQVEQLLLPLAISFFTFQQIAYLIDVQRHQVIEKSFSNYLLFVCFFPQLIAGPIVHHSEMMPQFKQQLTLSARHFAVGLSIFSIGLFKKTVLADGIAQFANPVFTQAEQGVAMDFFAAWGGALAYTFQLYFDFSGYSDMAIGIALLFGIALPLNFNSPYKALNIVDFWRRWHITLSRFLRDYLYISLGGNRFGFIRRYSNLFITMLLGGLWHGAGWNFLIWGALHGLYLVINHGFSHLRSKYLSFLHYAWFTPIAWLMTFLAVVVGWVFFRATSFDGALAMLTAMTGQNGISLPAAIVAQLDAISPLLAKFNISTHLGGGMLFVQTWLWILTLLSISVFLPNVMQLFYRQLPAQVGHGLQIDASRFSWHPTTKWACLISVLFVLALSTLGQVSEFLYFNF